VADRPVLAAVLLDAGGTLVRLDFEWMAETLATMGIETTAARIRRGEIAGRRAFDLSRGHPPGPDEPQPPLGSSGDTHAYFGGMLAAAGVPRERIDAVLEVFWGRQKATGLWTRPMEHARESLAALSSLGLRLAVVSNSDGRAEQHLRDCGVLEGIEFVVDSHRVGVEKPDPAIFRVALERLGVDAGEALFVGDIRSVDEGGARAAGLHFVLLDPDGDYAAPGSNAIHTIRELPAWVAEHFRLSRPGAAGTLSAPAHRVPPATPGGLTP
jgi:putative hydrolase of the HAD superfamily